MEIILNTEFLIAQVNNEESLIHLEWYPRSAELSEEAYKIILLQLSDYVLSHNLKYWLGNTKNFAFSIPPDLQNWTSGTFTSRLMKAGMQKMALVIPNEYSSNLSVQQTMNKIENVAFGKKFQTRYFKNEEDALKWLLEEIPESLKSK